MCGVFPMLMFPLTVILSPYNIPFYLLFHYFIFIEKRKFPFSTSTFKRR
jgi:hypothetical protein